MEEDPTNPAAVLLIVEIALARGGSVAALDTYEQWRRARRVDSPYVLRRVARSTLLEVLQTSKEAALRSEAARGLAAGGEPNVADTLKVSSAGSNIVDTQTLASLGDPQAIDALATALQQGTTDRMIAIHALAESGSPRAIDALLQMLDHPRPELRAAAARGLGRLNARAAIPRLQALLADSVPITQLGAAVGLHHMQDASGTVVLQARLGSGVSAVRLEAASALASNPDAAWMSTIRRLLGDPDPVIQIGGARLLAPHDPAAATATIDRLAQDPNLAVREEAQRVAPDVVGNDFDRLRALLRAADPIIRVRAAARMLSLTR